MTEKFDCFSLSLTQKEKSHKSCKDAVQAQDQFLADSPLFYRLGLSLNCILIYYGLTIHERREKLLAMTRGRLFDASLDCVGGEEKQLCIELTGNLGQFSTAELSLNDRKSWNIYARLLGHITELLEKSILKPPYTQIVGALNAETVKHALTTLKEGHVKGKLVMALE